MRFYSAIASLGPILTPISLVLSIPLPVMQVAAIVEIEQVLARFSVAVDTKELALLDDVFDANASANFNDGSGILQGRDAIREALDEGLAALTSQHYLTTITVDLDAQNKTAKSRSYLQGTFFGQGLLANQTYTTYG
ncbi:MAG: hypothetical protein M1821_002511 [Bathelium mastoideum]|nr:MAG: hypothetical protein M1821_002511 [Bathelium mastoideum]